MSKNLSNYFDKDRNEKKSNLKKFYRFNIPKPKFDKPSYIHNKPPTKSHQPQNPTSKPPTTHPFTPKNSSKAQPKVPPSHID